MPTHSNGETDWSKIAMGIAVAIVFVMQQYHAMIISDIKSDVVPRAEYESRHEKVMDKDDIKELLQDMNKRLLMLESAHAD